MTDKVYTTEQEEALFKCLSEALPHALRSYLENTSASKETLQSLIDQEADITPILTAALDKIFRTFHLRYCCDIKES
jgi:hypothetical protein